MRMTMTAHNGNGTAAARAPRSAIGSRTAVAERESQIVLGIDPDPAKLWPAAVERTSEARARLAMPRSRRPRRPPAEWRAADGPSAAGVARLETAAAVLAHCRALIDAAAPACVAVKPQLACFERLGAPGWLALEHVCAHARERGLLVLADGKRGDVPVTAAAYGQALVASTPSPFGPVAGLGADAFTANPLLGRDALEPLDRRRARARRGRLRARAHLQPGRRRPARPRARTPASALWERLAALVDELGAAGRVRASSDVGAVTGATEPEHLARLRELMPHTPFLLPGIGAQGGDVEALAPAFAPGRAGGLVTASRSIANAHEAAGARPPTPPAPRPSGCASRRGDLA